MDIESAGQADFSDEQIKDLLSEQLDYDDRSTGMVAGIVDSQGYRVISHEVACLDNVRCLDGDTVFEIGSITKVFTGLLLSEMVQRGEVHFAGARFCQNAAKGRYCRSDAIPPTH